MSPLRLVACDLDGTLLDADGVISGDDIAALQDAHARGVLIVIASGRPIRWLDVLEPIAALHPRVIASNGAVIYDLAGRRVESTTTLAPNQTAELVDAIARAIPDATFGFEDGIRFAAEADAPLSPLASRHGVECGSRRALVGETGDLVKLIVYSHAHASEELCERVRDATAGAVSVTHSAVGLPHGLVEVAALGVDKAAALDQLARAHRIDPNDAAAFGDMPNDAAMLAWAGRGFAVRDAHPSLAQRYRRVGSVGEGVRMMLNRD